MNENQRPHSHQTEDGVQLAGLLTALVSSVVRAIISFLFNEAEIFISSVGEKRF